MTRRVVRHFITGNLLSLAAAAAFAQATATQKPFEPRWLDRPERTSSAVPHVPDARRLRCSTWPRSHRRTI